MARTGPTISIGIELAPDLDVSVSRHVDIGRHLRRHSSSRKTVKRRRGAVAGSGREAAPSTNADRIV